MDGSAEGVYPNPTDGPSNGDNGSTDDSGNWFDRFTNWFNSLGEGIKEISTKLTSLPTTIANAVVTGIKGIFIPDTALVKAKFETLLTEFEQKFNFDTEFFKSVFSEGKPVEDIETEYYINGLGNIKLKIFDTKYLIQGVDYFRPFIRGFIVLLLALYNIKQVLSFIRQDAGVVTGKAVEMGGKK